MMFRYVFHCRKCGFYKELPTKEDCKLQKQDHKRRGCELMSAPHKNVGVLARPQLAIEARKGKEMVEQALHTETLSLEVENEANDSTSR